MSFVRRVLTSLGGASLAVAVLVALGLGPSVRGASVATSRASSASIPAPSALATAMLACESAEDADYDDQTFDVILEAPPWCELGSRTAPSDDLTRGECSPRARASCVGYARGPPA